MGEIGGMQILVVPESIIVEIVEDTIFAERKVAESDHNGDELVWIACTVPCRKIDRRRRGRRKNLHGRIGNDHS